MIAFSRLLDLIDRVALFAASLTFLAMMGVTVVDVVMRYALNAPLTWSFELIGTYLMAAAFFLAVSATQAKKQHVNVDVIAQLLPPRLRAAALVVAGIFVIVMFALIWWAGAASFWEAWRDGLASDGAIAWPLWPVYLLVPLGLTPLLGRLALELVAECRRAMGAA